MLEISCRSSFYPLLVLDQTKEDRKMSGHDSIIVDWEVKHQHKQTNTHKAHFHVISVHDHWAATLENLSSGFPTK